MATNFIWTGAGADGLWNNPANWSPSGIPSTADTAFIPLGVSVLSSNDSISGLGNQGVLGVAQGSYLRLKGTINNSGTILFDAGGNNYIGIDASLGTATLTGGGDVRLSADTARITAHNYTGGTLTNQDNTIRGFGYINNNFNFVNNGAVNADVSGHTLRILTPNFVNTGTLAATNGGTLNVAGSYAQSAGVTRVADGSTILVGTVPSPGTHYDQRWPARRLGHHHR